MLIPIENISQITSNLLEGKIGVFPTDTIYGIQCLAQDSSLVNKVIGIKQKMENMPMITLISSETELEKFGVVLGSYEKSQIKEFWPGPNTLIFVTNDGSTKSFRMPKSDFLMQILTKTGPLVSTSANLHGLPHSTDVNQAISYFGDKVDFYVDGGVLNNPPSSIYKIFSDRIEKIR